MSNKIQSIVIIGGGTAGWMTAALMSKLLKNGPLIRLIESEEIGTIGVGEATIPAIKLYNRLMDLDEVDFMKSTQATFKMGIEFENWGQVGESYMHGFGKIGQEKGWTRAHHFWRKYVGTGKIVDDFNAYSINALAAYQNRFMLARPELKDSPLSEVAHAYHFDAGLYAQYLRRLAESSGTVRTEGKIVAVQLRPQDGFVQSVQLENGDIIEGDLFVDCSGIRGLLIEGALETGYEDWSHWLPTDSALAVPCESTSPLLPYTKSIAHNCGWQWRIPLQHRIGNGHVYASRYISEDEATHQLMSNLDGKALAEPRLIKYIPGRRKKAWNRNVVAIGLSCGFLEPLESTSIHLIQTHIIRLLSMLPDKQFYQADIDEFNTQSEFEYTRIRDFIIAHYKQTKRDDSPMWQYCRNMEIPDSLRRKLDLFSSHGRVFKEGNELFVEESWIQVLLGQGLMPQSYDAVVDIYSDEESLKYLNDMTTVIGKCVKLMPSHSDFVAQYCAAAQIS